MAGAWIAHERPREGLTLLRYALEVALEHDKPSAALRAYYNLADSLARGDRFEEGAETARDGLALARRVGNRYWEWSFMAQMYAPFALGEWDEVLAMRSGLPEVDWSQARLAFAGLPASWVPIQVHRGRLAEAEALMAMLAPLVLVNRPAGSVRGSDPPGGTSSAARRGGARWGSIRAPGAPPRSPS